MTQDFLTPGQKSRTSLQNTNPSPNYKFYIESYGVKIGFTTYSSESLEAVKKSLKVYLPDCFTEIKETDTEHDFLLVGNENGTDTLFKNKAEIINLERKEGSIDNIASRIRLTVAEFADGYVFIHAGVVARKDKAIIIPGRSFHGKTTLTAALIERGAVYYSDEYAILDREGLVHPFTKMLSMRGEIDEFQQIDYPVEKFGAVAGTKKIRAGMVLLTEYKKNARWNPKFLTPANGIIEIIRNTVPIRQNPKFTLNTLQKITSESVIVKSNRPDVARSADAILRFIDEYI